MSVEPKCVDGKKHHWKVTNRNKTARTVTYECEKCKSRKVETSYEEKGLLGKTPGRILKTKIKIYDSDGNLTWTNTNVRKYEDINPEEATRIINNVNDVFSKYEEYLNDLLDYCQPLGIVYDSSNKILAINLLFAKALKTFYAIYVLCKEGYGSEAYIMFRSLMDIKINMRYLWYSDESVGDRFIEYTEYLKYDYLTSRKKHPKDYESLLKVAGDVEELKKKYNDFKSKYKNAHKHYWSGLPIKEMIKKLPELMKKEELDDYETVYRICSFHVHSNMMALGQCISSEGIFRISPNLHDIETIFPVSILYILQIIPLWLDYMKVPPTDVLLKEFDELHKYIADKFTSRN